MNKEDALRRLPSICTTAVTIVTDFMQLCMSTSGHLWGHVTSRVGCHVSADEACHGIQVSNQSSHNRKSTRVSIKSRFAATCQHAQRCYS